MKEAICMKVSTLEVWQREFAPCFRGYDPAEVDTFLELVAGQLEDVGKENARLREALARQKKDSQRAGEGEDDWKKALMAAQQILEALEASNGSAELVHAAGGMRDLVNKGVEHRSPRPSATASKRGSVH